MPKVGIISATMAFDHLGNAPMAMKQGGHANGKACRRSRQRKNQLAITAPTAK
jgi:hypothetical protein